MDKEAFWGGFLLGFLFLGLLLIILGADAKTVIADFRKQAIEHNAAHWTIDPKTGDEQFTWKQP